MTGANFPRSQGRQACVICLALITSYLGGCVVVPLGHGVRADRYRGDGYYSDRYRDDGPRHREDRRYRDYRDDGYYRR